MVVEVGGNRGTGFGLYLLEEGILKAEDSLSSLVLGKTPSLRAFPFAPLGHETD